MMVDWLLKTERGKDRERRRTKGRDDEGERLKKEKEILRLERDIES
jgi:hypothetical protein